MPFLRFLLSIWYKGCRWIVFFTCNVTNRIFHTPPVYAIYYHYYYGAKLPLISIPDRSDDYFPLVPTSNDLPNRHDSKWNSKKITFLWEWEGKGTKWSRSDAFWKYFKSRDRAIKVALAWFRCSNERREMQLRVHACAFVYVCSCVRAPNARRSF